MALAAIALVLLLSTAAIGRLMRMGAEQSARLSQLESANAELRERSEQLVREIAGLREELSSPEPAPQQGAAGPPRGRPLRTVEEPGAALAQMRETPSRTRPRKTGGWPHRRRN
jgi:hypothetical protein